MDSGAWTRRHTLKMALYGFSAISTAPAAVLASGKAAGSPPPLPAVPGNVVFDALGEIRTVYTADLVDRILDSGTRAISITLTDPKVDEANAFDLMLKDLADYNLYFRSLPGHYLPATSVAAIRQAVDSRRLAVFYNLQDSSPVNGDLSRVALLRQLGVTSIQLTYNHHNRAGSGCFEDPDNGLTAFGRDLVEEMAKQRVLVDLSHAGMRTMAEAIAASPRPVIVSHTACKALRAHRRNTTDENMRAVAARGGVVGITQIRTFLTDTRRDNLDVYFDHIDHAIKVAGIDHVGIGSDRDHRVIPDTEEELAILLKEEGSQISPQDWPLYLEKLNGPHRMDVIRDQLQKRRYSQSDIDKVMGGNVLRLYADVVG
jgi:membrane dipeptidase